MNTLELLKESSLIMTIKCTELQQWFWKTLLRHENVIHLTHQKVNSCLRSLKNIELAGIVMALQIENAQTHFKVSLWMHKSNQNSLQFSQHTQHKVNFFFYLPIQFPVLSALIPRWHTTCLHWPVTGSSLKLSGQRLATHRNEPGVLRHSYALPQLCVPIWHSSSSTSERTKYENIKEWKNSTCWLVLVVCKIMVFSPFKLKATSNIWMPLKCTLEMGIAPQNMP